MQWHFDAVSRLGEAQTLARLHPRRFLCPAPLWWALDWNAAQLQWNVCVNPPEQVPARPDKWQPTNGSVLLIDEIDKADTDLPNSLLATLGNGDFTVPYLGTSVRQSEACSPPLVVITTNEERELPAAFLRRCLVLQLSLPKEDSALLDFLCQRGEVHFQRQCTAAVRRQAAALLLEDRKAAVEQGLPAPGQAEYLDLLRAVSTMEKNQKGQLALLDTIRTFVLRKSPTV